MIDPLAGPGKEELAVPKKMKKAPKKAARKGGKTAGKKTKKTAKKPARKKAEAVAVLAEEFDAAEWKDEAELIVPDEDEDLKAEAEVIPETPIKKPDDDDEGEW
ncbi:MAG: hypothetical protein ACRD00_02405 [Thermoanaerobaculia bacterium]